MLSETTGTFIQSIQRMVLLPTLDQPAFRLAAP
jgi:hypothetical protein